MTKILLLVAIVFSNLIYSQVTIENNHLIKDGQSYKLSQYDEVFQNPEAKVYIKKARTNNTVATILGFTGGLAIGGGLGDILFNNKKTVTNYGYGIGTIETKPDHSVAWLVTGIGAGLVGIGIPFAIASKKNAEKAINLENSDATAFQPYFKIETAGNGFALSYNF